LPKLNFKYLTIAKNVNPNQDELAIQGNPIFWCWKNTLSRLSRFSIWLHHSKYVFLQHYL